MSESSTPLQIVSAAVRSDGEVGQSVDNDQARIFPCDGCGADLKFNIGSQSMKCPFCGHEKQIEIPADAQVDEQDFNAMLARLAELRKAPTAAGDGQKEVRCDACGGTVVFVGSLTSSECPYCASPIQLKHVHDALDRVPVDGVLPFRIDQPTARNCLARWIRSLWFAPNEFKRRGADGRFNGVYLPYWTFDTLTANRYVGERGEHYYDTETYTDSEGKLKTRSVRKTRWWPVSGHFQMFFDDVLVPATVGLPQHRLLKLEPWPLKECVGFNPQMLAGFLARTYETELQPGFDAARQRIDRALRREAERRIGGDEQRVHSVNTQYGAITYKHLLLPLWLMAYRYNNKTFQVFVNAATGEVQGERPYSWVKILLTVLAGVGLVGAAVAIVGAIVSLSGN